MITIALVGGGSGTSGSQLAPWGGSASFASQSSKLDVTLSTQGMLRDELQSQVSYSIVQHERESFDVFNKRVADAGDRAYEYLAHDVTNQLITRLPKIAAATPPVPAN